MASILHLIKPPCGFPVVDQYHGDPLTLMQQVKLFHVPQKFTEDKNFGLGQLKSQNLGPEGS